MNYIIIIVKLKQENDIQNVILVGIFYFIETLQYVCRELSGKISKTTEQMSFIMKVLGYSAGEYINYPVPKNYSLWNHFKF